MLSRLALSRPWFWWMAAIRCRKAIRHRMARALGNGHLTCAVGGHFMVAIKEGGRRLGRSAPAWGPSRTGRHHGPCSYSRRDYVGIMFADRRIQHVAGLLDGVFAFDDAALRVDQGQHPHSHRANGNADRVGPEQAEMFGVTDGQVSAEADAEALVRKQPARGGWALLAESPLSLTCANVGRCGNISPSCCGS